MRTRRRRRTRWACLRRPVEVVDDRENLEQGVVDRLPVLPVDELASSSMRRVMTPFQASIRCAAYLGPEVLPPARRHARAVHRLGNRIGIIDRKRLDRLVGRRVPARQLVAHHGLLAVCLQSATLHADRHERGRHVARCGQCRGRRTRDHGRRHRRGLRSLRAAGRRAGRGTGVGRPWSRHARGVDRTGARARPALRGRPGCAPGTGDLDDVHRGPGRCRPGDRSRARGARAQAHAARGPGLGPADPRR